LPSTDAGRWTWRAAAGGALFGPSLVLLAQIGAILLLADVLRVIDLPREFFRPSAVLTFAVVALVTTAQVAMALWRHTADARAHLLLRRLESDAEVARVASADSPRAGHGPAIEGHRRPVSLSKLFLPHGWMSSYPGPSRLDEHQLRIFLRFGIEPTWAYHLLDEAGHPAARLITRQARLRDARAAGRTTAAVVGVVAVGSCLGIWTAFTPMWQSPDRTSVASVGLLLAVGLLTLVRVQAVMRSYREFTQHEDQFYPRLERLLEVHRFDLYGALSVQTPQDTREEHESPLAAWRWRGSTLRYASPGATGDADVRGQVHELTDLLRGPELVGYDGFVSWEFDDDHVRLMFAGTPMSGSGSSRLQVAGTATAPHAPFDITANSDDLDLVQVRAAVAVPVDGRPARVGFDFTTTSRAGGSTPVIWFEIRQHGRFVQLLRVEALPSLREGIARAAPAYERKM
jgi:hypothetical protein